jgi:dipeptidyl aminopeptidase/acylaminoacyl peptidase
MLSSLQNPSRGFFMFKWSAIILALIVTPTLADTRGFTAQDMVDLRRISAPTPAPNGKSALYVLRETNLAANKASTDIWSLNLASSKAAPQRLTNDAANDSNPVWSTNGAQIYFLSARSGSSQIWHMQADGSAPQQLTKYPVDVAGFQLSPDGMRFAFWAEVFPDCDTLQCTADRIAARKTIKATGKTFDKLFVRHWDTWKDGSRSQLFSVKVDALETPVRLSKSLDGDVPSKPQGDGSEIAFSPDSQTLYFALREAGRTEAWSTNLDIFAVAADGSNSPRNITASNKGQDSTPLPSPDGKSLAWLSMARTGFEADKERLMVINLATGVTRDVSKDWDRSISAFAYSADSKSIIATALHLGTTPLWRIDLASGKISQLTSSGTAGDFALVNKDILFARHDLRKPADLFVIKQSGGKPRQLTQVNSDKLTGIAMGKATQINFKGAKGETVYAWVVAPAQFDKTKKYPVAFLVHGGPQSSFGDQFHYRWNAQTYAGRGYGVVMIDFHGSKGYGQAFTDSITQDWGGKPLEDLKLGWAAALKQFTWLNEDKACALGGSYGGYMMAWIASQWADEFQCLVNHAGIMDKHAMAYTTEELWFDEWENGGPPYAPGIAEKMAKDDPVRFVDQWRTPTLVIHGEKDYRVPYTQGLGIFTALQRKGIPSRLLMFPDENHWILKPANSIQWHDEVLGWLDQWLKPET